MWNKFFQRLLSISTFYFLERSASEEKDMIMEEVTLPCFFISLPKAIFVTARLVGPFSEKL